MAEPIPDEYAQLIRRGTADVRGVGEEMPLTEAQIQYRTSPELVDWEGSRDQILGAMSGANAAYEAAKSEEEKQSILMDQAMLRTMANDLEREYNRYQYSLTEEAEKEREKSFEAISSGAYKEYESRPSSYFEMSLGAPAEAISIDLPETKANFKEELSGAIGVHPDDIEVDTGLPKDLRLELGILPTDEDRAVRLQDLYGKDNVIPLPQDGKTNFLINRQGKLQLVNNLGGDAGDLLEAYGKGVTEVIPTVAGIGGFLLSGGGILGGPAATAGAYGTAATAQDVGIRKMLGLDARPGEAAVRRGKEAAVMSVVDAATMGGGKFLSRRFFGEQVGNRMVDQLNNSMDILAKEGVKLDATPGVKLGPSALEAESILAGKYPGSKLSLRRQANMDQLRNLVESWQKAGDPARVSENTLSRVRAEQSRLAGEISSKSGIPKDIVEKNLQKRLAQSQQVAYSKTQLGKKIRSVIELAEQAEKGITENNYRGFYNMMDKRGVGLTPDEAINMVRSTFQGKRGFRTSDKSAFYKIVDGIKEAKDDGVGLLSFEELNNIRRRISKAGGSGVPGATGEQALAKLAAEDFDKKLLGIVDKDLRPEWSRVNQAYKDEMLEFERGSLGRILKERYGGEVMTPDRVAAQLLNSPTDAKVAIEAAGRTPSGGTMPDRAAEMQSLLKQAYTEKLGLTKAPGVSPPKSIKYDLEMLQVIYGDKGGKVMAKKYDALNDAFAAQKVKLDDIDPQGLTILEKALSKDDVTKVTRAIAEKAKLEQERNLLFNNAIMKMASESGSETVNNGALASAAISRNTKARDLAKLVGPEGKMPEAEREIFEQDFMYELLNSYSSGGKTLNNAPYIQMPNAQKFLDDIGHAPGVNPTEAGRQLRTKMDLVLGKRKADKFIAAMDGIRANQIIEKPLEEGAVRGTFGAGGASIYLAQGLTSSARNRLLAAAFGDRKLEPFINVLARRTGPAQTEAAYRNMIARTLLSTRGLKSLAQQMSRDPEFAAEMVRLTRALSDSEEDK
tara:strand:+ start:1820 stop:4864 length:3045 start_codon:yes stop_codon:yes gene_type:complete